MVVKIRIYIVVMALWSLVCCYRRLKFGLWSSGFWYRVFWLVATVAYQTTRYQSSNDHGVHFHRSSSLESRRSVSTAYKRHSPYSATYDCCSWCCSVRSHPTQIDISGVPLATEPGISLIILPLMRILQRLQPHTTATHYRHTLQTHSSSFLTQRTYSCSNFVAISSLVLELLKKCRAR